MKKQEWLEEFSEFAQSDSASVPEHLHQKLQMRMRPLLNPNALAVFGKIFAIHFAVGALSLAVCNQFGLNPFQTSFTLDRWLMAVGGHNVCMPVCGFFFLMLSFLSAQMIMTIEELKILRRNGFVQTLTLSLTSLALFYFFGAELVFGMATLWLMGALFAGVVTTEVTWKLRTVQG